ncbi:fumarate/succinate/L-aspartate dehydrogenase [Bacillus sp. JCM 19046]|nr:fumarate/succinate/L-aspartate dehydrogenase [Bacillus sp. JCM 19046]
MKYDAIIVGAGLAGLVAATEIAEANKHVLVLDQEPEASIGGQAWWSFGGLFLVNSPEQRRMGIKDTKELAWQDWLGTAGFDRLESSQGEDFWGHKWAEAYVDFAAGEKRSWLHSLGIRFFRLLAGLNEAVHLPTGTGIRFPAFILSGGQDQPFLHHST